MAGAVNATKIIHSISQSGYVLDVESNGVVLNKAPTIPPNQQWNIVEDKAFPNTYTIQNTGNKKYLNWSDTLVTLFTDQKKSWEFQPMPQVDHVPSYVIASGKPDFVLSLDTSQADPNTPSLKLEKFDIGNKNQRWTLITNSRQEGLSTSDTKFTEGVQVIQSVGKRGYALDIPSSDSKEAIKSPVLNKDASISQSQMWRIIGGFFYCIDNLGNNNGHLYLQPDGTIGSAVNYPGHRVFWTILPVKDSPSSYIIQVAADDGPRKAISVSVRNFKPVVTLEDYDADKKAQHWTFKTILNNSGY